MPGKRELIEPHSGTRRYVRRDSAGRFLDAEDVSRARSMEVDGSRKKVSRSAKTGRVERAISSASERTGAFKKK